MQHMPFMKMDLCNFLVIRVLNTPIMENEAFCFLVIPPLVIHPYPFNVGDVHTMGFSTPFEVPGGPPSLFRDHEVESEAMDMPHYAS